MFISFNFMYQEQNIQGFLVELTTLFFDSVVLREGKTTFLFWLCRLFQGGPFRKLQLGAPRLYNRRLGLCCHEWIRIVE